VSAPVVVFDVNETLSDLGPLGERFAEVGAPTSLAPLWFASVLRDGIGLAAAGGSARFADIGAEQLRTMLPEAGVAGDLDAAVAHVMDGFMTLATHPDVVPGARALRAAGLRLVTLSNGSAAVAESLLTRAGVREAFEALLSVEDAGCWKPAAAAYRFAAERCQVPLGEMVLVAVHPWDIDGAARAGMRTVWLDRDGRPYPSYASEPTHRVRSLEELAGVLTA
jgi:2-haloacid dehalogenase